MNMGEMSMGDDMQMMMQEMDHSEERKDMACERCEQNEEELSVASVAIDYAPSGVLQVAFVLYEINHISSIQFKQKGLPLANAGPPLRGDSLVGTVVMRV